MQTNEPIPQSNEFDAIPTQDDFDVMMKIHNDMNALRYLTAFICLFNTI